MLLSSPSHSTMNLSVVIPAFNERDTIEEIVRRVRDTGTVREIIVVDDMSTDGTRDVLNRLEREANLRVLYHDVNRGKGAALRTGFAAVTGELVIVQDADLEYNPEEYPRLARPILDGRADVVFGSRFSGNDEHRVLFYWHSLGNKFLTTLSNMFTNLNLSDMETCYKMFRADVLRKITIEEDRFGFEPEITAKIARLKCRVYEVGISYSGRDYTQGKKIGWRDGVWALWCVVRYSLR
jgi:glycosyltransferase involved in cell wall biosynthesis